MTISAIEPDLHTQHQLSGSQLLIKLLERQGVTHITGIPGGANLPMYDALSRSSIKHVLARHEQGAGFIAQGMARVSGEAQVCFASSGPGASNLITAVADAKMDSIPLIAITGQVPQAMIGTDAFQEIDTFGLMLPITKHNWMVRSAGELLQVVPQAFQIALSGRPGPVSIDIPKDVQKQLIEVESLPEPGAREANPAFEKQLVESMLGKIKNSQRPILMVGGGIVYAHACQALIDFAEQLDLPTIGELLDHLPSAIRLAPNKTRNTMNSFVIGVGIFVAPMTDKALEIGTRIGRVEVDVGKTACKDPLATDYINKVVGMGRQGKKRKAARC